MNLFKLIAVIMFLTTTSIAHSVEVISTRVQCTAERIRQDGNVEVSSILHIRVKTNDSGATLNYVGHVGAGYNWDEGDGLSLPYYGLFSGKSIPNTLSPRARKYKDTEYYRFADFDANTTTSGDGGGMWGYLVVSKQYFDTSSETFDAHYVFQSGDHMGGTVDYVCNRQW